ncbi:glycylpeptide N-tetradecanoyltransferase [Coccomyxa viridis]|uniref:Glycylpeptide N-tetradecanoyltransferase n=1 Tax=Coccomyxa viridis TaxID=1274662 RepID=A0AAV1IFX1_9CHLO|nr:glycylpeptide N-tetradecanoyltransferase [Coccomyxa viridis]
MSHEDENGKTSSRSEASGSVHLTPRTSDGHAPTTSKELQGVQDQMDGMSLERQPSGERKKTYAFWETQPVAQFNDSVSTSGSAEDGPIDAPKTVADVRQEPYNLPESFVWSTCDVNDTKTVEEVYQLLTMNYVEDDEAMFRFNYSQEFLQWALQPPGYQANWVLGVRVSSSGKLVAFITGVPATVRVRGKEVSMVEINFLCVHKKLRAKRLAPVLIKEITRRVNLRGIWQAAYTAGVVLPKPVATAQYWHRSLNPKKLISVGFSRLAPRMTLARTLKLYKLPDQPQTPGLRPLTAQDVPQVTQLLSQYLSTYELAPIFTEEEVLHYLMPVEGVIDTHVVEDADGKLTDMLSFYTLPSTIIGNPTYKTLKAAFMYYTVAKATPLQQLMTDALILAAKKGHDVFNALDIFENDKILKDLKFGIGDGRLRYYLYNWRVAQELKASQIGLVLL